MLMEYRTLCGSRRRKYIVGQIKIEKLLTEWTLIGFHLMFTICLIIVDDTCKKYHFAISRSSCCGISMKTLPFPYSNRGIR